MDPNTLVEILKVVIWPITIFIFFIFFTVFFQVQIRELLKKMIVRYKKGETELEVIQQNYETKLEPQILSSEATSSSSVTHDDSSRLLDTVSKSPDELMSEMVSAILNREFEKGEILYSELQKQERDPVQKLRNEGLYSYYHYQRGDTTALNKLIELTKNPDISHYAHYYLGLCYEKSEDYERAFNEHKLAVQEAKDQERRAIYVVSCARSLHKNDKKRDALQFIMVEIAKTSDNTALVTLYKGMADLFELEENNEYRGLALEKAIEYEPNDAEILFIAAYSYSEIGANELALLHYKTLLNFFPEHEYGLNNIGVAYNGLNMPIKSIDHQKKAFDLGNTLAASNLALGYVRAGFSDEASKIIEKAREQKYIHKNVGTTFSYISDKIDEELKQEKEILEIARAQQRFMRAYANAYFVYVPDIVEVSGTWYFPNMTEVNITQQKESFTVEWKEKEQLNKFNGQLLNRAAQINNSLKKFTTPYDETGKLYVSPDNKTIDLMIKKANNFEFMRLEKKQGELNATN